MRIPCVSRPPGGSGGLRRDAERVSSKKVHLLSHGPLRSPSSIPFELCPFPHDTPITPVSQLSLPLSPPLTPELHQLFSISCCTALLLYVLLLLRFHVVRTIYNGFQTSCRFRNGLCRVLHPTQNCNEPMVVQTADAAGWSCSVMVNAPVSGCLRTPRWRLQIRILPGSFFLFPALSLLTPRWDALRGAPAQR